MTPKKQPHTFVDAKTSEVYCQICGGREKLQFPMPATALTKFCAYFQDKHKHCKKAA